MEREKEEFDRCFKKEKEQKEEYFKKANIMEKRCFEAQAELVVHRQRTHKNDETQKKLEQKVRELQNETLDIRERLEGENLALRQLYEKTAAQRERLKAGLQEYEKYLGSTLARQFN